MFRRIILVSVVAVACAAAAAALVADIVGADGANARRGKQSPSVRAHSVPFSGSVYRLRIAARLEGKDVEATEWVAPESGTWRIHAGDLTYLSSPSHYVVVDGGGGVPYVRTGRPAFIGNLRNLSFGIGPLRRHLGLGGSGAAAIRIARARGKTTLHVDGRVPRTVTIETRLTPEQARRAGIFTVSWASGRNEFREVPVGRPSRLVNAYWLGPVAGDRRAVIATEWVRTRSAEEVAYGIPARSESEVHTTIYGAPGSQGRNSAIPGVAERPAGEIQVSSEPLTSAHAQVVLRAIDGENGDLRYDAWPRQSVKLAGGQAATLVLDNADSSPGARTSFLVIAGDTLVSVVGSFTDEEAAALARTLRPVA